MARSLVLLCLLPLLAVGQDSTERLNRTIELLEAGHPVFGHFLFDMSDELAITATKREHGGV